MAPEIGSATEPAVLSGGIHVSHTLIPDSRFEDFRIRVMNVHSEPITMPMHKGTDVAALQPLEILGPIANGR